MTKTLYDPEVEKRGIEVGKEIGKEEEKEIARQENIKIAVNLLARRFGKLDTDFEYKLNRCTNDKIKSIISNIFDIINIDEMKF